MTLTDRPVRFSPRETGGVLLGLRASQLLLLGAAAVLVSAGGLAGGLRSVLGLLAAAGCALAALVPVRGATAEQWLPVLARYLAGQGAAGPAASGSLASPTSDDDGSLTGPYAGLQLRQIPGDGAPIGVVVDTAAQRYTAVASVSGATFPLLATDEQTRRVSAWGSMQAWVARAGTPVAALAWVENTTPDSGASLRRWWQQHGGHGSAATSASYAQLLAAALPVTQAHDVLIAVTIDAHQARRLVERAGGGEAGALAVLGRELVGVADGMRSAQLTVHGWLPPRRYAGLLRAACEPRILPLLDGRPEQTAGVSAAVASPAAEAESWSAYRSDDGWHATYWVAEWPRTAVGADFLAPLLLHTSCHRRVALIAQPVPPARAARQVRWARTSAASDAALRARMGTLEGERSRAEAAAVEERDAELVAGHGLYQFRGFVTVTAGSAVELEDACAQVEQAAQQAQLELRRLYGRQREAWVWTLPVGRWPR